MSTACELLDSSAILMLGSGTVFEKFRVLPTAADRDVLGPDKSLQYCRTQVNDEFLLGITNSQQHQATNLSDTPHYQNQERTSVKHFRALDRPTAAQHGEERKERTGVEQTSARTWRHTPPLQAEEKRYGGIVAPPVIPNNAIITPLIEIGDLLMLATCDENFAALSFYNGLTDKSLGVSLASPPDTVPLIPGHHSVSVSLDPSTGYDFLQMNVLPGETKTFCKCMHDAIPRPAWKLTKLKDSTIMARTLKMRQIIENEYNTLTCGLLDDLEGEYPEGAVWYHCCKKNLQFVDLWFPPQLASTISHTKPILQRLKNKKYQKDLQAMVHKRSFKYRPGDLWARPCDFSFVNRTAGEKSLDLSLAVNNLEVGPLGSGAMLCVCAILSEGAANNKIYFDVVRSLFRGTSKAHSKTGAVSVHLPFSGWWRDVLIDTYLPVVQSAPGHNGFLPAGIRAVTSLSHLWPSYLEKAYAKALGDYSLVQFQPPHILFQDITGFPSLSMNLYMSKSVLSDLIQFQARGFIISLVTPLDDPGVPVSDHKGFRPGHMYLVLQVCKLQRSDALFHIRNLWPTNTPFTGMYQWEADIWSPKLKALCGLQDCDLEDLDGTVMMGFEEVCRCFPTAVVTFFMPEASEVRLLLPLVPSPAFVLELRITTDLRVYIGGHKLPGEADTDPITATFFFPESDNGSFRIERSTSGDQQHFLTIRELEASDKAIYISIDTALEAKPPSQVVVSLHFEAVQPRSVPSSKLATKPAGAFLEAAAAGPDENGLVHLHRRIPSETVPAWMQQRQTLSSPQLCRSTCQGEAMV